MALSEKVTTQIDHWLKKFPADRRRSAVIAALLAAQEDNEGWLSDDVMKAVANYLKIPEIEVFEVATFYDMYQLSPAGKHKINICTNVACYLRGGNELLEHVENRLGVKAGQSTPDGRFTLKEVECLGACCDAPVCQVDDKEYHELMSREKMDALIEDLNKECDSAA